MTWSSWSLASPIFQMVKLSSMEQLVTVQTKLALYQWRNGKGNFRFLTKCTKLLEFYSYKRMSRFLQTFFALYTKESIMVKLVGFILQHIGRIDLISFGVVQSTFLLIVRIQLVTVPDVLIVLFNGTVR